MKKILTITIISLLFALTATTSYAYWNGGKLSLPPLFSVHKTIRIGEWKQVESNGHPIGTVIKDNMANTEPGNVFFKDGNYYLVFEKKGWWDFNSPYGNHSIPYTLDYLDNAFYSKGSYVIYNDKIYLGLDDSASDGAPGKSSAWKSLGNQNSLRWKSSHKYNQESVVFFNNKIYIRNNLNQNANPQPGTEIGWNLYNDPYFDQFTVYKKYTWKSKRVSPVIAAADVNGDLRWFKLMTESNYINGRLVKPTEDNSVWSPYPYE